MSSTSTRAAIPRRAASRLWVPHQHGAWAMLALPIVVGVAVSRFVPAHLLLVVAALAGYLFSSTLIAWLKARRRPGYGLSLVVYGVAMVAGGAPLLVMEPRILLVALVVVPAAALTLRGARPGTPRELVMSVAQVAEGVVLAPIAMLLAGEQRPAILVTATLIVAVEMAGSVMVVRSCIRERDNPAFAALSATFHATATAVAFVLLALPWVVLGGFLAARALLLPIVRRRRAASGRPLRPVQVGMVEAVASLALVIVAFVAPLAR